MDETIKATILMDEDIEEILEIVLNSSSSDDDDDEDENAAISLIAEYCERNSQNVVKNYDIVVQQYTEKEYITHFRMRRTVVENLIHKFKESEQYQSLVKNANSRSNITPEKHILVFLTFAGHQTASFRSIADRFELCLSSLHDVITRVTLFLSEMAKDVICLPNEQEKKRTIDYYKARQKFPNIIGCIDACHIKIDPPSERPIEYFNEMNFHSIVLQGTCNEELNFIDIFIGFPGASANAYIFKNSTLCHDIENICGNGNHLLGDSAYPLLPQLITPYCDNGHLSAAKQYFNSTVSSCTMSIKNTFVLLKQRFRQLHHLKLKGHERICHFIRACCVLHNIAHKEDRFIFELEEAIKDDQPKTIAISGSTRIGNGKHRDEICKQLYLERQ